MAKQRPSTNHRARALENVIVLTPQDEGAEARWPLLLDLLMPRYSGEACVRRPAVLKIDARGNAWSVSLVCPSEGVQCTTTHASLVDVFNEVERLLGSGTLHWIETWEAQKKARRTPPT